MTNDFKIEVLPYIEKDKIESYNNDDKKLFQKFAKKYNAEIK
ncbi:hypothetical protein [Lactobacillus sp.]|nr:hypothetical protein [Lactobacillus sp.]